MDDLRQAAQAALTAIEQGESFDHLDQVIAPGLRAALAEPEQLNQALLEWKEKGEAIMAQAGIGFRLGEWWADRPWRKHE